MSRVRLPPPRPATRGVVPWLSSGTQRASVPLLPPPPPRPATRGVVCVWALIPHFEVRACHCTSATLWHCHRALRRVAWSFGSHPHSDVRACHCFGHRHRVLQRGAWFRFSSRTPACGRAAASATATASCNAGYGPLAIIRHSKCAASCCPLLPLARRVSAVARCSSVAICTHQGPLLAPLGWAGSEAGAVTGVAQCGQHAQSHAGSLARCLPAHEMRLSAQRGLSLFALGEG